MDDGWEKRQSLSNEMDPLFEEIFMVCQSVARGIIFIRYQSILFRHDWLDFDWPFVLNDSVFSFGDHDACSHRQHPRMEIDRFSPQLEKGGTGEDCRDRQQLLFMYGYLFLLSNRLLCPPFSGDDTFMGTLGFMVGILVTAVAFLTCLSIILFTKDSFSREA